MQNTCWQGSVRACREKQNLPLAMHEAVMELHGMHRSRRILQLHGGKRNSPYPITVPADRLTALTARTAPPRPQGEQQQLVRQCRSCPMPADRSSPRPGRPRGSTRPPLPSEDPTPYAPSWRCESMTEIASDMNVFVILDTLRSQAPAGGRRCSGPPGCTGRAGSSRRSLAPCMAASFFC